MKVLYFTTMTIVCWRWMQRRHRSDNKVNHRKSWVLRDGELVEACWETVVVGDIIKLENDQFVAVGHRHAVSYTYAMVTPIRFNFDSTAVRREFVILRLRVIPPSLLATACQNSLRSRWRNTGRWPATPSHAGLFIYLGRSSAARSWCHTVGRTFCLIGLTRLSECSLLGQAALGSVKLDHLTFVCQSRLCADAARQSN